MTWGGDLITNDVASPNAISRRTCTGPSHAPQSRQLQAVYDQSRSGLCPARPQLNRHGYDVRALCDQFDAKPADIPTFMRGELTGARGTDLTDEMRVAWKPGFAHRPGQNAK